MSVHTRTLLVLAWPIVLARATQAVVGFADALMIAPLGSDQLAAVGTGGLNAYAFVMLPMGTVFIVQSFSAQLFGRRDVQAARRYAYYGLLIAVAAGVLALCAIPFVSQLLRPFGYAPRVHAEMTRYMQIRLLGVMAIVGSEALGNWYGGLGNTRLAMIAGVITMVSNVLGNYLLIQPRFGLPGYGVAGTASSSTIASWLGFAVLLTLFAAGYGYERAQGSVVRGLRWSELQRVLRFGLPSGANWFLEFAAFALFINLVVGSLGTSVLAAMNVVIQINSISFMPAFGVASAGAILVGNAIGANQRELVPAIVGRTLAVSCVWMASTGLLYFLAPARLIGLFRPGDVSADELLAAGAVMLGLSALWQVFDAAAMTLSEALRSAGDTVFCMNARIVLSWLVFVPSSWIAVRTLHGGVHAMMLSMCSYMMLLAAAFAWRFNSGRWRAIDLLGEPAV
jgi:MATE family multidrug resistance protein